MVAYVMTLMIELKPKSEMPAGTPANSSPTRLDGRS